MSQHINAAEDGFTPDTGKYKNHYKLGASTAFASDDNKRVYLISKKPHTDGCFGETKQQIDARNIEAKVLSDLRLLGAIKDPSIQKLGALQIQENQKWYPEYTEEVGRYFRAHADISKLAKGESISGTEKYTFLETEGFRTSPIRAINIISPYTQGKIEASKNVGAAVVKASTLKSSFKIKI